MLGKIDLVILGILGEQVLGGVPMPLHANLARSEFLSAAFHDEKPPARRFAPGTGGCPFLESQGNVRIIEYLMSFHSLWNNTSSSDHAVCPLTLLMKNLGPG